tara:strand:- start:266 stop:484 length:219 start_codon:yes stop_codon:yes gene_type:complete
MSKKIPSQDSNYNEQSDEEFRQIWMEMDKLDPLTPLPIWDEGNYDLDKSIEAFKDAADKGHDDIIKQIDNDK